MGFRESWPNLTFKEKVDLVGDVVTIIVSIMAIWGSIAAWESGFFHKAGHLLNYYHKKIVQEEQRLENNL